MSLIVDAHEDVAWNVLCFGRDYLHGAYAIRRQEAGGPVEAATGVAMLGLPDWLAGSVAVIFGTLFTLPERKRTNPIESHYTTPGELILWRCGRSIFTSVWSANRRRSS